MAETAIISPSPACGRAVQGKIVEARKALSGFPFSRLREKVAEGRMRVFSQLLKNRKRGKY